MPENESVTISKDMIWLASKYLCKAHDEIDDPKVKLYVTIVLNILRCQYNNVDDIKKEGVDK